MATCRQSAGKTLQPAWSFGDDLAKAQVNEAKLGEKITQAVITVPAFTSTTASARLNAKMLVSIGL